MGVFVTFLLQITFFIGCFTLDTKRIERKQNGMLPCIVHENFIPKPSDPSKALSWKFINALYSRVILTAPGKIVVIIITLVAMSIGIAGSLRLEQWFDPIWLLPKGSYLKQYLTINKEMFPRQGFEAFVLMGDNVNYTSEFSKIMSLTERLENTSFIQSVDPWPTDFGDFVSTYFNTGYLSFNISLLV